MLSSFIRFTESQYIPEEQNECRDLPDNDYRLPIKSGDIVKFIVEKDSITYRGDKPEELKIGLSSCGIVVAENIGTITEGVNQAYCTATIPGTLNYFLNDTEYNVSIIAPDKAFISGLGNIASRFPTGKPVRVHTNFGYEKTEVVSATWTGTAVELALTDNVFQSEIIAQAEAVFIGEANADDSVVVSGSVSFTPGDVFIINGNKYIFDGIGTGVGITIVFFDSSDPDFVPLTEGETYTIYHFNTLSIPAELTTLTEVTEGLSDCVYEFVIYADVKNINCSVFKGMTLERVIATGVKLQDVLQCTLNDFLP